MTETRDKIVEAMSGAACKAWGYDPDQTAEWLPGGVRWKSWAPKIEAAFDAMLAKLPDLGLAIVSGLRWESATDNDLLFVGNVLIGGIDAPYITEKWHAYLGENDGGHVGWYLTRYEARAALMARAREALRMDREPLGKEE